MRADDRRIQSLVPAVGLFMIFQALFYRDTFAGLELEEGFGLYCYWAQKVCFWLFLLGGIALLKLRRIGFWSAYLGTMITGLGIIYSVVPGREASLLRMILEPLSFIFLTSILAFSQYYMKQRALDAKDF